MNSDAYIYICSNKIPELFPGSTEAILANCICCSGADIKNDEKMPIIKCKDLLEYPYFFAFTFYKDCPIHGNLDKIQFKILIDD